MKRLSEMDVWYQGGSSITPSPSRIKRYLLKKLGPFCKECNWSGRNPFTKVWVAELDHIDGNHSNFDPTNYRLLCPNCHAMTPTYRGANMKIVRDALGPYRPIESDY